MTDRKTFTDLGVAESLAAALTDQGITHPFPIQELTLPLALDGADLIGQARTGTGKTLAFGLPLLQRIDPDMAATQALVIVPTRELCIQVADDLTVGAARGVTVQSVYGGVGYDEQIEALTSGVHVVVGTPGRTLDHLERGNLKLGDVHVVVLDEADEMLDMGFLPDVERLLQGVPEERQTLLFSATMPTAIVKLARRFMQHPTFMRADTEDRETAPTVDQHFFLVHRMDKPRVLARILQTPDRGGAFVFTRTKSMADRLVRELDDLNVAAIAVHGDLRQSSREKNLDKFRSGKADVLVATEVAARGLDVTNVTHVFNYDCPDDEKMYLHRIGRTARAGAAGVAVTFAEFNEVDRVNVIRKAVGAEGEVEEIFSTSDLLSERFGLPETTPWDHLASQPSGSGSRGSSRSGSRGSSGSSRRSGTTDGRPKSKRSAEGPSSRRRKRDDDRGSTARGDATASDRSDETPGPSEVSDAERREARQRARTAATPRERSRTRTRERTREAPTERSSSSSSSERSGSSSTSSSGRTRARGTRTSGGSSSGASNAKGQDTGGQGRNRSTASSNGSGRARQSSGGRQRGESSGDGPSVTNGRPTRRGDEARGEGKPRPRRRVQVEHLP